MLRSVLVSLAIVGCGRAASRAIDAPLDDSRGGDAARGDASDPACAQVACVTPPPPACTSATTRSSYAAPGTCSAGACSYPRRDRACVAACSQARCAGAWAALAEHGAPGARYGHTAVWTGREMIVWGGATASTVSLDDGARYDPVHGTWRPITTTNAPSPRRDHSAVWTGAEMIVWGGTSISQGQPLDDGGRYDPNTDQWSPLVASATSPSARFAHTAVWTGHDMIVWGGATASTVSLDDGARFDPSTSAWTAIAASGPGARRDHAAVWTGAEMLVHGGSSISAGGIVYDDLWAFDPAADTWSERVTTGAPLARFGHVAVWIDDELVMWGGATSSTRTLADGARLDPATQAWTPLASAGEPEARRELAAVWDGAAMLVWGGSTILDGGRLFTGGGRFAVYQ